MKYALIIAAIALTLGSAAAPAQAQSYVVNGRAASAAEGQLLVAHGFPPGQWSVSGFGITAVANASNSTAPVRPAGRACWYVLDELLCD